MKHHRWFRHFLSNNEGSILIITGLTLFVMMAVGGAAIDLGRQQLVRSKLQQASDAASIAAAVLPSSASDAQRVRAGQRYFALNFPNNYLGVSRPPAIVSVSGSNVSVTATVDMPTRFIGFIGIKSVASQGRSVVALNTVTTSGKYDLVLVMDVSGSMASNDAGGVTRIQAQRNAANQIANNLLNPNTTDSRIAAVTWHDNAHRNIDFQSNFGPVQGFNNGMVPVAGTNSTAGLQFARTNFAPRFRSDAVKAVVLITDGGNGANVSPYSTYAINRASLQECNALKNMGAVVYTIAFGQTINDQCTTYCNPSHCSTCSPSLPCRSLTPPNQNDPELCGRPFLQACASAPANFFSAPNQATLNQAFAAILTSIQNMRIVE